MNKHYSLTQCTGHYYAYIFAFFIILCTFSPFTLVSKASSDSHSSLYLNDAEQKANTKIAELILQKKKIHTFTKKNLFELTASPQKEHYKNYVTQADWLTIHQNQLEQLFFSKNTYIKIDIPTKNGFIYSLELMKMEVLSPDFNVTISENQQLNIDPQVGIFYWGMIENNPQSLAAIAIYKNRLTAIIADETGTYELGSLEGNQQIYVFYNTKDLLVRNQSDCSNDSRMNLANSLDVSTRNSEEDAVCGRAIEVYIEADYLSYQAESENVQSVVDFITSFFNVTALLYFNEEIPIQLSEIMVWTSPDPYANQTSLINTLYAFSDEQQDDFNGDLAHLVSIREGANSISGVAWINALCVTYDPTDHSARTAYTQVFDNFNIFPSQSGTVSLFAHEMGHNCGSRHTHACVWGPNKDRALDNCMSSEGNCNNGTFPPSSGGSIMSYCYDIDYLAGFWEEPGNLIREIYRGAGCFRFGNDELILNENPINNGVHLATERIESAGTVVDDSFVRFISAQSISLEAGFEVELGADFEALIDQADYCPDLEICAVPELLCGIPTSGNHSFGESDWTFYCDRNAPESPKTVYQFTTTITGDVTIMTTSSNASVSAIMGACDNPNSCIAFTPHLIVGDVNYVTAQNLAAGTYYVVVGGEAGGDFEVELICTENAQEEIKDRSNGDDKYFSALRIVPNPASDMAHLRLEIRERTVIDISLYHFTGQRLKTITFPSFFEKGNYDIPFSVRDLPKGSYFVVLNFDKKREVLKLVVV